MNRTDELKRLLKQRILVLDGAMGTMVQSAGLDETDYRGDRFGDHPTDLRGNADVLSLTQPDVVRSIHRAYLEAGADIIETNTFNANPFSQGDYGLESAVYAINLRAAQLAVEEARRATAARPEKPRFVAGAIGPTNQSLSISRDVNDPTQRTATFVQIKDGYVEQIRGLVAGGVDVLLPETSFDTLNFKAALFAIEEVFERVGLRLPVMMSGTITDASGRTLSGQTLEAFWISVSHMDALSVGLNCAFGAAELGPFLHELARIAPLPTSCYPNAGLPNELGEYDQTPDEMAGLIREFATEGWVNIVGGCCGTRAEHIRAIAETVAGVPPRVPPQVEPYPRYSGLEPLVIRPDSNFIMIGERTNVTGSRRFARLIKSGDYEGALAVARDQIEGGANIIDINMDEGLLDSIEAMRTFLRLIAAEPDISVVPIMLDSSNFGVIEVGLQEVQGKPVVNSISLKEGEEAFLRQARLIRRHGAGVVVMAFDEQGQAVDAEHKVAIAERAYRLLTEKVGFPAQDIIFDPNVLTVATGMEEHDNYAVEFIEACRAIKDRFPLVKVSGGISNLSFSFRGNNTVREAIHSVFLYHAIAAGLDMGIVNAGQLVVYEDIPPDLLELVEDVVLNRRSDATDRLLSRAESLRGEARERVKDEAWRREPLEARLSHALVRGLLDHLEEDIDEALAEYERPLEIIEGPLMDGMRTVGDLFGAGKMFLPQVVKSARVMKRAVAQLLPYMESERAGGRDHAGSVLMATVKGDVHDIGKNIVGVVLGCNNYRVIDLGVMVPCEKILSTARSEGVDMIGLSGLITPSLDEMVYVAQEMERQQFQLPLLIGGATTSRRHTAVKIAPAYSGPTIHVLDASRASDVVSALLNPRRREALDEENRTAQARDREAHTGRRSRPLLSYERAVENRLRLDWSDVVVEHPELVGSRVLDDVPLDTLVSYIDWTPLFVAWELRGTFPRILDHPEYGAAARELYDNARALLEQIVSGRQLRARAVYGFFQAASDGDDIVIYTDETRTAERARLVMLRQQRVRPGTEQPNLCLADYIAPPDSGVRDYLGAFAVTAGWGVAELVEQLEREHDDYNAIMVKALADRLAEALAELLHEKARRQWYSPDESLSHEELLKERYRGIRPAPGYPACPDHTLKSVLFDLLDVESAVGISLTESLAMFPAASVSGFYFGHPESHYFTVGPIGRDQLASYAKRRNISVEEAERWLRPNLG